MSLAAILGTILGLGTVLAFLSFYVWIYLQVWRMAESKNRNPGAWVLLSFLITPVIAYFVGSMCRIEPWEK
jgi:hypothetical protein